VERFRVQGGARLAGEVRVTGAKNSVLKLMAAALLAEGTTTIAEVPDIVDVEIMSELLRRLGCHVTHDHGAATVTVTVPQRIEHRADYDLVRRLRASISVLGPLLARTGEADVALPGGDAIGSRPLDLHIAGLAKMGATIANDHGFIVARAERLRGASIWLDFPSVGATENLLMAAVLADGRTVVDNAAREPEIVDLCWMLQEMGASIDGVGTSTLEVTGVDGLRPTSSRRPGRPSSGPRTGSGWRWTGVRSRWTRSRSRTRGSPPTCCRWRWPSTPSRRAPRW
jgi:UDP-N-acetylglucosamine 1-carboxyvinyltransferase